MIDLSTTNVDEEGSWELQHVEGINPTKVTASYNTAGWRIRPMLIRIFRLELLLWLGL